MAEGDRIVKPKTVVRVIRHVRDGEYGKTARYEFPNNDIVFGILSSPSTAEKGHNFYYFNNILIAKTYSMDVDQFLVEEAMKLGYVLKIENRRLT
ncbi:MAG: hypothetical protein JW778_00290 [Candidatus Altiarchaeota archaeon]|nr:hypothetical protein [Candidatus Altiarchaeota archaeon]